MNTMKYTKLNERGQINMAQEVCYMPNYIYKRFDIVTSCLRVLYISNRVRRHEIHIFNVAFVRHEAIKETGMITCCLLILKIVAKHFEVNRIFRKFGVTHKKAFRRLRRINYPN